MTPNKIALRMALMTYTTDMNVICVNVLGLISTSMKAMHELYQAVAY